MDTRIFKLSSKNPIISPLDLPFQAAAVLNPGAADRAMAKLWSQFGSFVLHHGEHFYNFRGLRKYKEKFKPEWQPKYLVCRGGLVLPRILRNLLSLTSGWLVGAVSK